MISTKDLKRLGLTTKGIDFHRVRQRPPGSIQEPLEARETAIRFHTAETGLIVLESACNRRIIAIEDARSLISSVQSSKIRTLSRFNASSLSGSETRVRNYFQSKRVNVRSQVPIRGIGIVDMVVDDYLIVECDSAEFHSTTEQYRRDRERDLQARQLGFKPRRLSYDQM